MELILLPLLHFKNMFSKLVSGHQQLLYVSHRGGGHGLGFTEQREQLIVLTVKLDHAQRQSQEFTRALNCLSSDRKGLLQELLVAVCIDKTFRKTESTFVFALTPSSAVSW